MCIQQWGDLIKSIAPKAVVEWIAALYSSGPGLETLTGPLY